MAISTVTGQTGLNKASVEAIQDYYMENSGEFMERTFNDALEPQGFQVRNNVKDTVLLLDSDAKPGLQSYQAGHHHKGQVVFNGRQLQMRMVKNDQRFETRAFDVENYFSYLNRTGNDPRQLPYEAYILDLMMRAMYEAFKLQVMWKGRHLGPIAGAPNEPEDTADGFTKIITDEVLSGAIAPYVTGLMDTNANTYDGMLDFIEASLDNTAKEGRPHNIYTSLQNVRKFRKGYRDQHGQDTDVINTYGMTTVPDFPNVTLVPQDGLTGSGLCMMRPDQGVVAFDGAPFTEFRYESRMLYVEVDWKYGLDIRSTQELYVNEWFV